jgi:hypothetical protein
MHIGHTFNEGKIEDGRRGMSMAYKEKSRFLKSPFKILFVI